MLRRHRGWTGIAFLALAIAPVQAAHEGTAGLASPASTAGPSDDGEPSLWEALSGGEAWVELRYRFENVDQESFSKQAHASTLRTALGYRTAPWRGFSALLEFEDVSHIGPDTFNDTTNDVTDRPVVADPENSEINQAFLRYAGCDGWSTSAGRQRIVLDNLRFIGDVGWRQNEQTYDALSAEARVEGFELFVAHLANVNRVFADDTPDGDHGMRSYLAHLARPFADDERLVLYGYHLDYIDDAQHPLSSATFGARATGRADLGQALDLLWQGEGAYQSDAGSNPNDFGVEYLHAELGGAVEPVSLSFGYELLGGNGDPGESFQTPLALLHAFNGWADQFLTTPPEGLQDVYGVVKGDLAHVDLVAAWHDFRSEVDGLHYGTELDVSAVCPVGPHVTFGAKLADFRADDFPDDVLKFWIWLSTSF